MKIEVLGKFNPDGSSRSLAIYEIDDTCERVLVDPMNDVIMQDQVWGFKDDRQVRAKLLEHDPNCLLVA